MKKRVVLILICALVLTAFAGCGNSAENKTVLNWNIASEPATLDPQLATTTDSSNVINNTFEGLMREVGGQIVPGAAKAYQISKDGLIYTFHLRDSLWSDGKPVTASDFVYAWKRACDPDLKPEPSGYAYQIYYIKGARAANEGTGSLDDIAVKAVDDKTLVVELVAPTPYFLDLTTSSTFMPVRKDMVEKDPAGWARTPETAVSNGPFKLSEYLQGDRLTLIKNENYWNANQIKLTRITGLMVGDSATALSAYQAGQMDIIDNPPGEEVQSLLTEDSTLKIIPQIATYYYNLNTREKPFDDIRVRKALSLAIDRTEITDKVCKTGEIAATGMVPPGISDSKGKVFRTENGDLISKGTEKLEEAKKLLAEAGYPGGKGFPEVEITYVTEGPNQGIAEVVQQMWHKNLGIKVGLKNAEWQVFQNDMMNGNFDIAPIFWYGDYPDPMTMLDIFTSVSDMDVSKYDNKQYNALIEKAKKTTGDIRTQALYDAEKILMKDMPVIPLYYNTSKVMVKDYVKNWEMTKMSLWYFGKVTIEQ